MCSALCSNSHSGNLTDFRNSFNVGLISKLHHTLPCETLLSKNKRQSETDDL